jgi:electron transfer flavoprotein alpha subunit
MVNALIYRASIAALALAACRQVPSVYAEGNASRATASAAATDCPQGSLWLKDRKEVGRARGIDLPESNFEVSGCRDALAKLSKEQLGKLAHELDALVAADRAAFERESKKKEYRQGVAKKLNEVLGEPVVRDWSADLWQMAF